MAPTRSNANEWRCRSCSKHTRNPKLQRHKALGGQKSWQTTGPSPDSALHHLHPLLCTTTIAQTSIFPPSQPPHNVRLGLLHLLPPANPLHSLPNPPILPPAPHHRPPKTRKPAAGEPKRSESPSFPLPNDSPSPISLPKTQPSPFPDHSLFPPHLGSAPPLMSP